MLYLKPYVGSVHLDPEAPPKYYRAVGCGAWMQNLIVDRSQKGSGIGKSDRNNRPPRE